MDQQLEWENRSLVVLHNDDLERMVDDRFTAAASSLPEYRQVITPKDLETTEMPDDSREAMDRLRESMEGAGVDLSTIPPDQLKAASMTLSGKFGDQVTLSRMNPGLATAMQSVMGQHYQGREANTNITTQDQSSIKFLEVDGHYGEADVRQMDAQSAYRGAKEPPQTPEQTNTIFKESLAVGKQAWERTYGRTKEDLNLKKDNRKAKKMLGLGDNVESLMDADKERKRQIAQQMQRAQAMDAQRNSFSGRAKALWSGFKGLFSRRNQQQPAAPKPARKARGGRDR